MKIGVWQVLSPAAVTKLHVPLMIPLMTEAIRNAVDRNVAEEPTLWWEEMRQVAFTVATRAVLSTLISDKECKELYDLFKVMSSGILGLVRNHFFACLWTLSPWLSHNVNAPRRSYIDKDAQRTPMRPEVVRSLPIFWSTIGFDA